MSGCWRRRRELEVRVVMRHVQVLFHVLVLERDGSRWGLLSYLGMVKGCTSCGDGGMPAFKVSELGMTTSWMLSFGRTPPLTDLRQPALPQVSQ